MQYNHLGHLIKAMRQLKGLTQRELAEGICSVKQLSRIENGDSITNLLFLYEFSNKLGENLADFLLIFRCEEPIYILNQFKELEERYTRLDFKAIVDLTDAMLETKKKDLELPEIKQLLGWYRGVAFSNTNHVEIDEAYYIRLLKFSTDKSIDELCQSYLSQTELRLVHSIIAINCRNGMFEKAVSRLQKLIVHLENNYFKFNHKILLEMYFNLSKVYLAEFKYQKAIEVAKTGVKACKKNHELSVLPDFYYILGKAYEALGDIDHAVNHFSWFISLYQLIGHNTYSKECESELRAQYGKALTVLEILDC